MWKFQQKSSLSLLFSCSNRKKTEIWYIRDTYESKKIAQFQIRKALTLADNEAVSLENWKNGRALHLLYYYERAELWSVTVTGSLDVIK